MRAAMLQQAAQVLLHPAALAAPYLHGLGPKNQQQQAALLLLILWGKHQGTQGLGQHQLLGQGRPRHLGPRLLPPCKNWQMTCSS